MEEMWEMRKEATAVVELRLCWMSEKAVSTL